MRTESVVVDSSRSRILVAVDDSDAARAALRYAAYLASLRSTGEVASTVLTVWQPAETLGVDGVGLKLDVDFPGAAETLIERLVRETGSDVFERVVRAGSVAVEIVAEAEIGHHDLIVVGTRGLGAPHQATLGSVSQQVIGNGEIPVAVVPGTWQEVAGPVLVGFDGSGSSRAGLRWALRHTPETVVVLHVIAPGAGRASAYERLADQVSEVVDGLDESRILLEVAEGDPTEVIPAHESSCIVLGARSGRAATIWGSVTSHVVSSAHQVVVVVPSGSKY
jgi:nucleotide-binding universal stress UspA family protein